MPRVATFYPETTDERYDPDIQSLAEVAAWLLFMPNRLGAAYHKRFKEFAPDHDDPTLDGLAAFQEYRYRLGEPELLSAYHYVIPPSRALRRLGGPGRYNWNSLLELTMLIPYNSLFPDWRGGLGPDDKVPFQLRILEPNYSRILNGDEAPVIGMPQGTRLIMERFATPYLIDHMGVHGDQFALAGEQAAFYAEHRKPMWEMPERSGWVPTWVAYNEQFEDTFAMNPVSPY